MSEYSYSILGVGQRKTQISFDDCDLCQNGDHWFYDYPTECLCPDPICDYVAILVQILGSPVPTKPTESVYRVRIWKARDHMSTCVPDRFIDNDTELANDITLSATVDPADMEHQYSKILTDLPTLEEAQWQFRAPKSRSCYIQDFTQRVQLLQSTKDRAPAMDVDHVGRRKKGHSHAK